MCHPTPKVRQKKPGIIRVSGQLPSHQGNKANGLDGINDKFVAPATDPFEELMLLADRQYQHAVVIQLRQQRGRYFRRAAVTIMASNAPAPANLATHRHDGLKHYVNQVVSGDDAPATVNS